MAHRPRDAAEPLPGFEAHAVASEAADERARAADQAERGSWALRRSLIADPRRVDALGDFEIQLIKLSPGGASFWDKCRRDAGLARKAEREKERAEKPRHPYP